MKTRKLKIVNKKRFVVFLTTVLILLIFITGTIFKLNAAYSFSEDNYIEIQIIQGDTLWDIAKRNNPYNKDIRKVVYEIMKINNMKNANIKIGTVIKVPTY